MKNIINLSMVIFLLSSCAKDSEEIKGQEDFVNMYGGKPFVGTAKGIRSQNGVTNYTWKGVGRVVLIEALADSVSVFFMADFGDER